MEPSEGKHFIDCCHIPLLYLVSASVRLIDVCSATEPHGIGKLDIRVCDETILAHPCMMISKEGGMDKAVHKPPLIGSRHSFQHGLHPFLNPCKARALLEPVTFLPEQPEERCWEDITKYCSSFFSLRISSTSLPPFSASHFPSMPNSIQSLDPQRHPQTLVQPHQPMAHFCSLALLPRDFAFPACGNPIFPS